MKKQIDLTNKCGSCRHFKEIDGTAHGDCLANPYGGDVVHNPEHPYWQVARSRIKCAKYWARTKPQTNADRIRAMSDEDLAVFLGECKFCDICEEGCDYCTYEGDCDERLLDWLRLPVKDGEGDG